MTTTSGEDPGSAEPATLTDAADQVPADDRPSDPVIPFPKPTTGVQGSPSAFAAVVLSETTYEVGYPEAFWDYNFLRLIEHAFWVLSSHGIEPGGPFPLVCMACGQPWLCRLGAWAANWILVAQRHGLLDQFGLRVGDDILAIMERWCRDGAAPAEARAT